MTADASNIRETIKRLCEIEGSQTKFAKRIGATPQKVNNWVNGRNYPSADMVVAISSVYEIPAEHLIDPTAPSVEYSTVRLVDEVEKDAEEMHRCLRKMSETQRTAVLGVARAMVDC